MSDLNITIPLTDYLSSVLRDKHFAPVSKIEAEIIKLKTNNKHTCYVQEHDPETGVKLPEPLLWRFHTWKQTTDNWLELKRKSQLERDARFVFEENVNRLTRAVTRMTGLEHNIARVTAYQHIKQQKFQLIKNYYKVTLVTNIKEIQ